MDYSQFKRESSNRHQSEKLLDRDIVRFERKQNIEYFEKDIQKKMKQEEEAKKAQEEKLKQIKAMDIKCHEALDKILKHLSNPGKYGKALNLAKETIVKNLNALELDHVFSSLFEIMKNFKNYETADDKKVMKELFEFLDAKSEIIFDTPRKKAIFEIWKIEGLNHTAIFTDDSYQFNAAVKKIRELIDSLEQPIELPQEKNIQPSIENKTDTEVKENTEAPKSAVLSSIRNKLVKKPVVSSTPAETVEETPKKIEETPKVEIIAKKYEFSIPEEVTKFLEDEKSYNDTKKEILYEIIRDLYKKYRVIWAKPTIKQFFDDIFFKRDFFNPEQIRGIEDLKATLQTMKLVDASNKFKKDVLDSGIASNPLNSMHEVKDGRATTFSFDGVGQWANKQLGL